MFTTRRILVAGGTGAIGRRIVAALAANGDAVFGLARSASSAERLRALGATPIAADALDQGEVFAAVEEVRPDVLIHQLTAVPRGPVKPRRMHGAFALTNRLRREATRDLVGAAEKYGVQRVVAQSIAFAYQAEGPWVVDESTPLDTAARGAWGEIVTAIAALEEAVLAGRNFVGVVLRYGAFYGPETAICRDGYVADLVRRRRLPIIGHGGGMHSLIHIQDAAGGTLAALDGAVGIYNVVDDRPAPGREWVPAFASALGAPPPHRVPAFVAQRFMGERAVRAMTVQRGASNARIRSELEWRPAYPDWRAGFAALAEPDLPRHGPPGP